MAYIKFVKFWNGVEKNVLNYGISYAACFGKSLMAYMKETINQVSPYCTVYIFYILYMYSKIYNIYNACALLRAR